MKVTPIKTHSIVAGKESLDVILDKYVTAFTDKSILAVTSKIVSLCEGAVVPVEGTDKDKLVEEEADLYLPKEFNSYGFHFTITNNTMIASAGIDQSNGNGNYILWPRNMQKSANDIRAYLIKRFNVEHAGVIIVDSKTMPLRWGTVGTTLAHSGFLAIKDYIGTKDLFDYNMRVTKANQAEGLGGTACFVMGEGAESTPLALIEDLPFVEFQDRDPNEEELQLLGITVEEDLYAPILNAVPWKKGTKKH